MPSHFSGIKFYARKINFFPYSCIIYYSQIHVQEKYVFDPWKQADWCCFSDQIAKQGKCLFPCYDTFFSYYALCSKKSNVYSTLQNRKCAFFEHVLKDSILFDPQGAIKFTLQPASTKNNTCTSRWKPLFPFLNE